MILIKVKKELYHWCLFDDIQGNYDIVWCNLDVIWCHFDEVRRDFDVTWCDFEVIWCNFDIN